MGVQNYRELIVWQKSMDLVVLVSRPGFRHDNLGFYLQESVSWGKVTSGKFSARFYPSGFTFDGAGLAIFPEDPFSLLGLLNSIVFNNMIAALSQTLNFTVGDIGRFPIKNLTSRLGEYSRLAFDIARADWDNFETSWDFRDQPLLRSGKLVVESGKQEAGVPPLPTPHSPLSTEFHPDRDGIIPVLDGEWFEDDITQRFKQFLKATFGSDNFEANLRFVEESLGKGLRKYFLTDFYKDHVQTYKKRPIYWLFSSPKGTFNALIYMHRYRPDTVSVVVGYLRDFREKLTSTISHNQTIADSTSSSKSEKTKSLKDVTQLKKDLKEITDYEKDLFDVASQKIEINLNDGVKANYPKFGSVLKKIPGLEAVEE